MHISMQSTSSLSLYLHVIAAPEHGEILFLWSWAATTYSILCHSCCHGRIELLKKDLSNLKCCWSCFPHSCTIHFKSSSQPSYPAHLKLSTVSGAANALHGMMLFSGNTEHTQMLWQALSGREKLFDDWLGTLKSRICFFGQEGSQCVRF